MDLAVFTGTKQEKRKKKRTRKRVSPADEVRQKPHLPQLVQDRARRQRAVQRPGGFEVGQLVALHVWDEDGQQTSRLVLAAR